MKLIGARVNTKSSSQPGGGNIQVSDITFDYPTTYPFVSGDIGKLIGSDLNGDCEVYTKTYSPGSQAIFYLGISSRSLNVQASNCYFSFTTVQPSDGDSLDFFNTGLVYTVYFRSVVTDPTTEVEIGVDWATTYSNLVTFLQTEFSSTHIFQLDTFTGDTLVGTIGTDIAIGSASNGLYITTSNPGLLNYYVASSGGADASSIEIYDNLSTNTYVIDTTDVVPTGNIDTDTQNIVDFINNDIIISAVFSATYVSSSFLIIQYVVANSNSNFSVVYHNYGNGLVTMGNFYNGFTSGFYPIKPILGKLVSFSGGFAKIKMLGVDSFELSSSSQPADVLTNKYIWGDDDGKIQALDIDDHQTYIGQFSMLGVVGQAYLGGNPSDIIPVRILHHNISF